MDRTDDQNSRDVSGEHLPLLGAELDTTDVKQANEVVEVLEAYRSPSQSGSSHSTSAHDDNENDANSSRRNNISPAYILPLNFINSLAWSLLDIPLVFLLRSEVCRTSLGVGPNDPACRSVYIQRRVSLLRGLFEAIAAFCSVFVTPVYGSLSDHFARRFTLKINAMLLGLGEAWLLLYLMLDIKPYWVLLAALLKGCGGHVSGIIGGQNAYIADTTTSSSRSRYFGINFGVYYSGLLLGPIISGWIVQDQYRDRFAIVFGINLCLWLVYIVYVFLVLPESSKVAAVDSEDEIESDHVIVSKALRFGFTGAWQPAKLILPRRDNPNQFCGQDIRMRQRQRNASLCAVVILLSLLAAGTFQVLPLYLDYRFEWKALDISFLISGTSLASMISLTVLMPVMSKFMQWILERRTNEPATHISVDRDLNISRVAYVYLTILTICVGTATSETWTSVAILFQASGCIAIPAIQSVVLDCIRPEYNGRMMSVLSTMEGVAMAIRGPLYAFTYGFTVYKLPQTIFIVSAVLFGVCSLIILFGIQSFAPITE